MKIILSLIAFNAIMFCSNAQNQINTISYDEKEGSPKASLETMHWIAGYWKGEAFGGITEELWAPASGHSMMCVFKLVTGGEVTFYEIVTLVEENETLLLRLKHFDKNLKGWEDKEDTIDFKLVKLSPNRVYFDGFTFERISESEINMYVMIGAKDGNAKEVKFNYKKTDL